MQGSPESFVIVDVPVADIIADLPSQASNPSQFDTASVNDDEYRHSDYHDAMEGINEEAMNTPPREICPSNWACHAAAHRNSLSELDLQEEADEVDTADLSLEERIRRLVIPSVIGDAQIQAQETFGVAIWEIMPPKSPYDILQIWIYLECLFNSREEYVWLAETPVALLGSSELDFSRALARRIVSRFQYSKYAHIFDSLNSGYCTIEVLEALALASPGRTYIPSKVGKSLFPTPRRARESMQSFIFRIRKTLEFLCGKDADSPMLVNMASLSIWQNLQTNYPELAIVGAKEYRAACANFISANDVYDFFLKNPIMKEHGGNPKTCKPSSIAQFRMNRAKARKYVGY